MRRFFLLFVMLILLMPGTLYAVHTDEALRPEDIPGWRDDLHRLANGIRNIHPDPFWRRTEAEFDALVAEIDANLPEMTRSEAILGFARLVNGVDGHSFLPLEQPGIEWGGMPLQVYHFDDGIYVLDARTPYTAAIGQRIVGIGDHSIEDVLAAIEPFIIRENDYLIPWGSSIWMMHPGMLHALSMTDDPGVTPFVFEDAAGEQTTVDVESISWSAHVNFVGMPGFMPQRADLLYVSQHLDSYFWMAPLPDTNALYVQYNHVYSYNPATSQSVGQFAQSIREALEAADYERVILDMRHNGGGDNTTYGALLTVMEEIGDSAPGRLVVLISRHTFSAAGNFVTDLEKRTDVTFVGTPTGARPNQWGDSRTISLPNTGFEAYVSARYVGRGGPDDTRDAVYPDIAVPVLASDWFAGVDPALEAALDA